jgi:hypothetical protein
MLKLKAKIVHDAKSENSVTYPQDKGSPLLKRRAPELPKPKQPYKDD